MVCSPPVDAQQPAPAVVGFLTSGSINSLSKDWIGAFHRGLGEAGYIEGRNVVIEYRAADDQYDKLPDLAAQLVEHKVDVIVAAGGPVSALAAKRTTNKVPIVFTTVADPVKSGLVEAINRPGGNVTGTAGLTSELDAKRLELLYQSKPSARVIGVLINPNRPGVEANSKELRDAAHSIDARVIFQNAGPEHPVNVAIAKLAEQGADVMVVTADPFFNFRRSQVIALAARHALPAIYQWREFVVDGGLMSYGPSIADAYYQAGVYSGRILKGARPADLPVMQPTKFELVINRGTAKSLGLLIPPAMISRADEVIE
jgi:putative ABC transport system substrate-binding protein